MCFYSRVFLMFDFIAVVYDGRGSLEEGETAEARFIKIQAAYELLIDSEERRKYDMENRANPMKVLSSDLIDSLTYLFNTGIYFS